MTDLHNLAITRHYKNEVAALRRKCVRTYTSLGAEYLRSAWEQAKDAGMDAEAEYLWTALLATEDAQDAQRGRYPKETA